MRTGRIQRETRVYSSAEFQLKNPGIFIQFKLRSHESEPMFVVIKKDSAALERIKSGNIIPMTYHFPDRTIPAEKRYTRIKYMVDGNTMGFKDHVMIALELDPAENNVSAA